MGDVVATPPGPPIVISLTGESSWSLATNLMCLSAAHSSTTRIAVRPSSIRCSVRRLIYSPLFIDVGYKRPQFLIAECLQDQPTLPNARLTLYSHVNGAGGLDMAAYISDCRVARGVWCPATLIHTLLAPCREVNRYLARSASNLANSQRWKLRRPTRDCISIVDAYPLGIIRSHQPQLYSLLSNLFLLRSIRLSVSATIIAIT